MIYNFNLGIGWASSGVEYAQAYRAKVLREIGQQAKFVFTDMFPRDNIQHRVFGLGSDLALHFLCKLQNIASHFYVKATGRNIRK